MTPLSIAGRARLDNRSELLRALELDAGLRPPLTDLDLILSAYRRWSVACPERLLGDFAFVVSDPSTGEAFGARDPLGIVPFYYRTGSSLAFSTVASGVAACDGLPLVLDERRVADVLVPQLEGLDWTSTFFHGVLRLPPGHRIALRRGRATVSRYWRPDLSRTLRVKDDREYVEAFRAVFGEAVRCRLAGRAASMLSGGLDSSAIVGAARRIHERESRGPLATVSAVTDDPSCEETRHIRAVAELPGLSPIEVRPEDVRRHRGEIEAFAASMEEPFDDTMVLLLVAYAAARAHGFTAVLDGVDGDAVASCEPDVLAGLLRSGAWMTAVREARGCAAFYAGTYEPWTSAWRLLGVNTVRAFVPGRLRSAVLPFRQARAIRATAKASMLRPEFASRIDLGDRLRTLWANAEPEVTHPRMAAALERYDRVAASQGIEPRHPFLDRRVVELALSLPWDQRIRSGWSKWIVRRSAEADLPDAVAWRRGRWVRLGGRFLGTAVAASRGLVEREMAEPAVLSPFLDLDKVRTVYDAYRRGDRDSAETIWKLSLLALWLRRNAVARYDARALANGPAAPTRLPVAG